MEKFSSAEIKQASEKIKSSTNFTSRFDNDFFHRVFATEHHIYRQRLEFAGLAYQGRVLDAGSGFGQWSLAMSESNTQTHSIDINLSRVKVLKELKSELNISSILPTTGKISNLPYKKDSFDAAFCYGAIFFGNWRANVKEIVRVVKPGSILYLNANSFAWYIYNLLEGHKDSEDFSTRKMAYSTIKHTISSRINYSFSDNQQSFIFPKSLIKHLEKCGTEILDKGPDGSAGKKITNKPTQFFPAKKYGLTSVYEVIAKKL